MLCGAANGGAQPLSIAYVNGRYRPVNEAAINIEDRGYQFGDGIYEVLYVHDGRLIDALLHLQRLSRSLEQIALQAPLATTALPVVIREVMRRNRVSTGLVYIQVTRGVARRDHPFPPAGTRPSLVVTARHKAAPPTDFGAWAAAAVTQPDQRWGRCDIKTINLLPNVLARQAAKAAGAYEAILYDADGMVTEGAASTVWMVDASGMLRTRFLDRHILPGCTRATVIAHLDDLGIAYQTSAFSVEALRQAREVFLTSATSFVKPITMLDGRIVGNGEPGLLTVSLAERYISHIRSADV